MEIIKGLKSALAKLTGREVQKGFQTRSLDALIKGIRSTGNLTEEQIFEVNSWVYACVRAIAYTSMHADLIIKDWNGEQNEKWTEFFGKPSPWFTGKRLIANTLAWMHIKGFAVWVIKAGQIELLDSDYVVIVERTPQGYRVDYFTGKGYITYDAGQTVIFQTFNPFQRLIGFSPLKPVQKPVTMQRKADILNDNLLDGGAFMPGYFTTDQPLTEAQRKRIRQEWQNNHAGYLNAANPLILEGGLEFKTLALTPADIQYIDLEKLTRDKISSAFGVPSVLINVIEKVNYATAKEQMRIFWNNTMLPILREVADTITYGAIPLLTNEKLYSEFDTSHVPELQADKKEQAEVAHIYLQDGVLTINEVREQIGKEPVAYGDTWWGTANILPLATATPTKRTSEIGTLLKAYLQKRQVKFHRKLDAETRRKMWLRFKALTDPMERKMQKELHKSLRRIVRDVKKHIEQQIQAKAYIRKFEPDDLLDGFDFEPYREAVQRNMQPLWTAYSQQGAAVLLADLGVETSFSIEQDPQLLDWIRQHTYETATQVTDTLQNLIRENIARAVAQGVEQGASTDEIKQAILDAVNHVEDLTEGRAFVIARTETARAVNWGQHQGALASGLPLEKEWIAQRDNVVRPAHRDADGQRVDAGAPFIVDGESLQYPGDPSASAANTVNCRCTVAYIPKREE